MPTRDVVVVGAGLAGLTAAIALADGGARVEVVAAGHAATHWTSGGLDIAGPDDARTAAEGVALLARQDGHPYVVLGGQVDGALSFLRAVLAAEGVRYAGELDDPLRAVPTAIGGTRRLSILPSAQAQALAEWAPGEPLVVVGPSGFKDFWPAAIARNLARPSVWTRSGETDARPSRVEGLAVDLPGLAGLHNLSALDLARRFDDPSWRAVTLSTIARSVERNLGRGAGRIALPAVVGLDHHAEAFEETSRRMPVAAFEVPLVPPSIPGIRLYHALRAALLRRGGRVSVGEPVKTVVVERGSVTSVAIASASRERVIRTGRLVLATGGIASGGLIGQSDGALVEPLLGLPVEAPPSGEWLSVEPFDPRGHPLEAAGIRTDDELRPLDAMGRVVLQNVVVAGSLLAGQRYLSERCGDGVAIASAWRAASVLLGRAHPAQPEAGRVAARSGS